MKKFRDFCMIAALIAAAVMVFSCQKEAGQDEDPLADKSGSLYPAVVQVDAGWLDAEITGVTNLGGGTYTFTVEWTLEVPGTISTTDEVYGQDVKTQGGLTAGVTGVAISDNLETPWKKQPKKNYIIFGMVEGLDEATGTVTYTVTFTKVIKAGPGEEVELTGDWTSKWEEFVDPTPELPDSGDEYKLEHQVGYAEPVTWTVPGP